jgi:sortase A
VRRAVGAIGRLFVTVGVLVLLFVSYQLWGTGLYTDREQDRLFEEFTSILGRTPASTSTTTSSSSPPEPTTTTSTTSAPAPLPAVVREGEALAQLTIERIGLDVIVVEGTNRDDLRKGPGHYPGSPLPGQKGNSAIAGHRTTYGAPFGNLDQLEDDDTIIVRTSQGRFTYRVYEPILVVDPTNLSVLQPDPNRPATITLTTCNPKYSAKQRLVVKAVLEEEPLPAPKISTKPKIAEAGLSGESGSKTPTLVTGAIAALIGLLWWLYFHRHPRWTSWLLGAVPFAVALFFFYSFLERVLPANY